MSDDELFKVVLEGYSEGKGEYYVERDLAALFKITEQQSKQMLQECPKVIKENLTQDQANKYEEAIKGAGAKCSVESMKFDLGGLSLE